jgi:uncharacterized oligopeptide transporter (OPT) family protein
LAAAPPTVPATRKAQQLGVLLASGLIVAEGIIARKLAKGFSG